MVRGVRTLLALVRSSMPEARRFPALFRSSPAAKGDNDVLCNYVRRSAKGS